MISLNEIEAWRVAHRMTKKELAQKMGVTYTFMVEILNGKRPLSDATCAKFERLRAADARVCRYDDVRAFAIRLTEEEYRQLCVIAGAQSLSHEETEAAVRELLQRTWDELAANVPQVVEESGADDGAVMPAPSVMPGVYMPAAHGNNGPTC